MLSYALKGTISKSMFPSEAVISFRDASGNDVAVVAPRELLASCPGAEAALRVRLVQAADGLRLVELPGEVYGGGRFVTVHEAQLAAV